MPIQNKTMLITYSDSLGNNLKDLYTNLEEHLGMLLGSSPSTIFPVNR